MVEGCRNQPKRAPTGQMWENVSIKINNKDDGLRLKTINKYLWVHIDTNKQMNRGRSTNTMEFQLINVR